MKATLALQQFKKCIILFMIGIGCSFLTYMIYIIDPMTMILKYNLQMAPHSFLFKMWQKPNVDVYLKIYIFNITNPIEFLSGKEKLKLQEIGPYVYQEYIVNDNITFNDNNTMSYIPRRTVVYVPEMSVGDPMEDIVNVPNVPYLGILSALSDAGFIVNYPIVQLANLMNTKPILNISVYDYLWGFEDSLIKLASRMMPNFIDFLKFGLLDRLYDEGENIVTINLQKNADMVEEKGRYLSIDKYNGNPGMAQWGYIETEGNETREENTKCNILQGATEGIVFPSYIDKRAIFRIYRKAFCRPLPIIFRKEIWTDNGLPGYLYTLTDDFASPPDQNPDNECFCRKMKTCLKKGLINLTPCYYNYLITKEFLRIAYEERLKTVGMPILFHSRMQTNLIMNRLRYNSKIAAFSDITIPLFWFDLSITSLSTYLTIILKLELRILPIAQIIFMYLLGIIGVMTLMLSLISIVWILNQPQQQEQEMIKNNDNSDLRVPLYNGHYTSINIVSPLKKIASQSYLTDYYN
ncbi:PREDICTED: scavenger receptor class B member 1 [Atta cephalotes]|uniref:Scavenger receptor class B member 1 n=1 Tax=Atta cephalotes TaxID=12957 RepID=A0A158NND4_ATTCE|nr:PREDICTED: scavenger receptor class B member 1 [Atta cephalotes]